MTAQLPARPPHARRTSVEGRSRHMLCFSQAGLVLGWAFASRFSHAAALLIVSGGCAVARCISSLRRAPVSPDLQLLHFAGSGTAAPAPAAGLPDDSIVDILSRVPVRSIHRFKCVSKAWRDLIANPLHRKRLPQTLEGFICSDAEIRHGAGGAGAPWNSRRHVNRSFISLPGRLSPLGDPSFSILTKQPTVRNEIRLLGCCNGHLLFANGRISEAYGTLGYIVCNPATKQWVGVPSAGRSCSHAVSETEATIFLIVDPAMSPHFHVVHIWQNGFMGEIEVRTYSSETGVWTHRSDEDRQQWQEGGGWEEWVNGGAMIVRPMPGSALLNGMLRFIIFDSQKNDYVIAAVDGEGKSCRSICLPGNCGRFALLIGQSQGRLHCVSEDVEMEGSSRLQRKSGLCVWVLEDYDTDEWVLKHKVSFLELFGKRCCTDGYEYNVLAIHPDRDMLFFVQHFNNKLVSYDMDSKELHAFHTPRSSHGLFTPYVPCYLDSSVLANKY
ncbi:hypothetical protein SETIT_2G063400v2 [Setaria italica]|uniref:F-box domain-containing protein n=1 Tax=Setaria italica TaxID=4555 RepID=A0A368PW36_SETIT|nr:hypothetical protein SETIT_2G063400v2 [Setaria italica]